MKIQETLAYEDVLLVPQYSDIKSRSECDTSVTLGSGVNLKLPIIASCMDTVTEAEMAAAIGLMGGLGVIHRYNSPEEQAQQVIKAIQLSEHEAPIAAAIGVTDDYFHRADLLVNAGASALCIDVAHGHHILVKEVLEELRATLGEDFCLIAGNVATLEGINDLADWGANAVRCNIGGGCFVPGTKIRTENGLKNIENVKVGDRVYTHTGNLKPVIDTLAFDRSEAITVINDIECTSNHEFYVVNREDVELINENNIHEYAKWIAAYDLDEQQHLLIKTLE